MHQCDYCCWYYNGSCDCPYVMKKRSCEKALEAQSKDCSGDPFYSWNRDNKRAREQEQINAYRAEYGHGW